LTKALLSRTWEFQNANIGVATVEGFDHKFKIANADTPVIRVLLGGVIL
jgi:hypothetical protein